MSASVGTLRKLARYYKLNILDFFEQTEASPHCVKPQQRKRLDAGPGVRMELLAWGNTVMEPHLFSIAPGAAVESPTRMKGRSSSTFCVARLRFRLRGNRTG